MDVGVRKRKEKGGSILGLSIRVRKEGKSGSRSGDMGSGVKNYVFDMMIL